MVVEKQVPDPFADRRFVVCDADVVIFDGKLGGGRCRVTTWDLE